MKRVVFDLFGQKTIKFFTSSRILTLFRRLQMNHFLIWYTNKFVYHFAVIIGSLSFSLSFYFSFFLSFSLPSPLSLCLCLFLLFLSLTLSHSLTLISQRGKKLIIFGKVRFMVALFGTTSFLFTSLFQFSKFNLTSDRYLCLVIALYYLLMMIWGVLLFS